MNISVCGSWQNASRRRKASERMAKWINCPSCNGEIGVPRTLAQRVVQCPNCSAKIDLESAVAWRPESANAKRTAEEMPTRDVLEVEGRPTEHPEREFPFAIRKSAPEWYTVGGVIAVCAGIAGFIGVAAIAGIIFSAAEAGGGTLKKALLCGALNPLFFVGVPLGVYWLYTRLSRENANNFFCPHCEASICLDCPHGDVVRCWRCGKQMTKP